MVVGGGRSWVVVVKSYFSAKLRPEQFGMPFLDRSKMQAFENMTRLID